MTTRIKGWEKQLKLAIEKHMKLPSEFGVSDCYLLPDDVVFAITGERMYPDITYTTEQGAAKLLLQRGFKTVEDAFMFKFPTVPVFQAHRGDIGVIDDNGQICGGVFTGVGFAVRDATKIMSVPISRVKTAFRVGR